MSLQNQSTANAVAQQFVDYKEKIDVIELQLRQYKKVIDLCPLPMFLANEHGRWVYVNQAMERLMGANLDEIQTDLWQEPVHPDDRSDTFYAWMSFVENPECNVYEHQHRYVRPDDRSVPVLVKAQQMPCKSIVGFVLPPFMNFADWLRGADLENLPPMPVSG